MNIIRRFCFSIALLLFSIVSFSQEITINPFVDKRNTKAAIYSVILQDDITVVGIDFSPVFSNNILISSVGLASSTTLVYEDPNTSQTVELHPIALAGGTDMHPMQFDQLYTKKEFGIREPGAVGTIGEILASPIFYIYFDTLPIGVDHFSIYEKSKQSYDISIYSRPVSLNRGLFWEGIYFTPRAVYEFPIIFQSTEEIRAAISKSDNPYFGFYEPLVSDLQLAFVQKDGNYYILHVSGQEGKWKTGELRAEVRPTASSGIYKATWKRKISDTNANALITFKPGVMEVSVEDTTFVYTKMVLSDKDAKANATATESSKWSGTGFALKDGYIVTNHHVVDGAKAIKVYGVNGNPNRAYTAEIVATDKNNDLALIKINDISFNGFATIPYSVKTSMAEVGENIFVLGYPLTQLMGNEVKLTNGIISSRSGYQGDISAYQMSAPVQPGNSGGPMLDEKGNVIGIVNAGISGADNVGYAIKTSYLRNLIENVTSTDILPSNNQIGTLTLPQKVSKVRDFVFFIMCEGN